MSLFEVWAPNAAGVQLVLGEDKLPMKPAPDGWHRLEAGSAPGIDYAFLLDGEGPSPDPRSPHQPQGVHGPSRAVDHAAFTWTDQGWSAPPLSEALIYELHVGTFSPEGTFDGVIGKLDHLLGLGVTHIELMPVAEFPGRWGWGYDGVDLFAVRDAYGGPEGFKRLVDASHSRGIAVILDVVYNHLGPSGNYLGRFGPYFTDRYVTPWGKAVNLDGFNSDEVRRFLIDNALMWLRDYHMDGLRLDAVQAIIDTSALHFLEDLALEVERLEKQSERRLVLIAESDLNDPRVVTPRGRGGYGLHAQWNDDLHHALHTAVSSERQGYYSDFGGLGRLAKALQKVFVYDGCYSSFRRRRHGRRPEGLQGDAFLGHIQNHDQIGNRPGGERISHIVGVGRARIAAALVLTSPFVPLLFQGEEWAATTPFLYFTDHEDQALAEAVSEGRRNESAAIGWRPEDVRDPQSPESFTKSRLDWSEPGLEPHREMLDWYRALARLRRENSDLRNGRLDLVETAFDEDAGWLTVRRGSILLACNLGHEQDIPAPGAREILLRSPHDLRLSDGGFLLPGDAVAILRLAGPEGSAG
ncbi:MAG: malto-oligosyltrehalose trehalohydrolase [Dehalococcoidia bacterium]